MADEYSSLLSKLNTEMRGGEKECSAAIIEITIKRSSFGDAKLGFKRGEKNVYFIEIIFTSHSQLTCGSCLLERLYLTQHIGCGDHEYLIDSWVDMDHVQQLTDIVLEMHQHRYLVNCC